MERLVLEDMTVTERRVAIARDVVAHIKGGRYMARCQVYAIIDGLNIEDEGEEDIQCLVDKARAGKVDCEVCGIGAGVVSATGLFNSNSARRLEVLRSSRDFLKEFFRPQVVDEIEAAFEMDPSFMSCNLKGDFDYDPTDLRQRRADQVVAWGGRWEDDPSDRLEAIYTNLAENKGSLNVNWFPNPRTRLGRAMKKETD